jgi:hypothetical protein
MWIYRGAYLDRRLKLSEPLGLWLDYWLFLNNQETHSIWRRRPLGIRTLVGVALEANGPRDSDLREHLRREIFLQRNWLYLFPHLLPPIDNETQIDGGPWSNDWLTWFEAISSARFDSIRERLLMEVCQALASANYSRACYFVRKTAELVADEGVPSNVFFENANKAIVGSNEFDSTCVGEERLRSAIFSAFYLPSPTAYQVQVSLAKTRVSRDVLRRTKMLDDFVVEEDELGLTHLIGLRFSIQARHPHEAATSVMDRVINALEILRLRFYIRSHVYGTVSVTNETTGVIHSVPIAQPFWSKANSVRAVPKFPTFYERLLQALPKEGQKHQLRRWNAAKWHLSSAFGEWAEDAHGSAAQVWYALECFIGKNTNTICKKYLKVLPQELARQLTECLFVQKKVIGAANYFNVKSWDTWAKDGVSIDDWLKNIMSPSYPRYYRRWEGPPISLLFDPRIGLLQTLNRRINLGMPEVWMERRLLSDLKFLYALRNKLVHEGVRVFSRIAAEYFARLGLEILFAQMDAERHQLEARLALARRVAPVDAKET